MHYDRVSYIYLKISSLRSSAKLQIPTSDPSFDSLLQNNTANTSTANVSATLTIIMALHTNEGDLGKTKYSPLVYFATVIATIALLISVMILAPIVIRSFAALARKIRERRERRQAAEDEENAMELAARRASGLSGGREPRIDSKETLCVPGASYEEHKA